MSHWPPPAMADEEMIWPPLAISTPIAQFYNAIIRDRDAKIAKLRAALEEARCEGDFRDALDTADHVDRVIEETK